MVIQKTISKKLILEFYQDLLRWESMTGYALNELIFLDKLLHAKAFQNTIQRKTAKMIQLRVEIKIINQEISNLMTQIKRYKNNVESFLECKQTSNIKFSFKNYKILKHNFSGFNTSYTDFETKIFEYTGGIL